NHAILIIVSRDELTVGVDGHAPNAVGVLDRWPERLDSIGYALPESDGPVGPGRHNDAGSRCEIKPHDSTRMRSLDGQHWLPHMTVPQRDRSVLGTDPEGCGIARTAGIETNLGIVTNF